MEPAPTIEIYDVTPAKRPVTLIMSGPPEVKRTKLSAPPTPDSRVSSPTLSSKGHISPVDIAAASKRVQELKAKRQATAKKQSALDEEMGSYQQKLQAELEALNREAEEEARLHEEEEQRLQESAVWLDELKSSKMQN